MLTEVSSILLGAMTEVEDLKKALAEAEDKAAKERAVHEKQEARVSEVQQELQDAVKKYGSLEGDSKTQESELARPARARKMSEPKPRAPSRKSRQPRRSRRVRLLLCKASM
jgi:chromosome segregation ATPase